jgi:PadR family transcriptional regulator PadR
MKKGILEYCILQIIQRGEAYPSDIAAELKESGMPILEGTMYPLLTRLKNAGYLDYRWVESSGGPPRKYFTMTETGLAFFKQLDLTWNEIKTSVEKIINSKNEHL